MPSRESNFCQQKHGGFKLAKVDSNTVKYAETKVKFLSVTT
jgi:hypothetical protein